MVTFDEYHSDYMVNKVVTNVEKFDEFFQIQISTLEDIPQWVISDFRFRIWTLPSPDGVVKLGLLVSHFD